MPPPSHERAAIAPTLPQCYNVASGIKKSGNTGENDTPKDRLNAR